MLTLLGKSTSYIERSSLTGRHFNSRLTRKTLAFSKTITMHQAAAKLEDAYYNLVRPHKTLRQEIVASDRRWLPRTPAMTSALTDHIWTVKELFSKIPVPIVNNT
ncbi:MAG: IS1 family transposase [Anaerolineae bacterium]|nr:IS1 family transposase [Anaerolineae bacterium]